jgi:hypothetical protein
MVANLQSFVRRVYHRALPPAQADRGLLQAQTADYFGLPLDQVAALYTEYSALHEQKDYAGQLGEDKTLCFEEAFLLFVAASIIRPQQVVEIGTQYGKSTRRILDMLQHLNLDATVTCFDIVNETRYIRADEVDFRQEDITNTFQTTVLDAIAPTLIYLDAHPYYLLKNVITEFLAWSQTHPCFLAIHDCTPAYYVPLMLIPKDDPGIVTTKTGIWERHVLAEIFHAPNSSLDDVRTPSHRLRVFATPNGLAMVAPQSLLEARPTESGGA